MKLLEGACAPPFCAVQRLSAPYNASSACWKGLSIRRREVIKGFGRREPESHQVHWDGFGMALGDKNSTGRWDVGPCIRLSRVSQLFAD